MPAWYSLRTVWPGPLGGDHDDVDVLGGLDAAEVDVEAVGEGQGLALGQVGLDGLLVELGLLLIVDEDHDDVGVLGRVGGGHDGEALALGLGPALAALVEAHNNLHAALLQVQRVSVALGAVADDGDGLAVESLKVAVLLIENSCHDNLPLSN